MQKTLFVAATLLCASTVSAQATSSFPRIEVPQFAVSLAERATFSAQPMAPRLQVELAVAKQLRAEAIAKQFKAERYRFAQRPFAEASGWRTDRTSSDASLIA